MHFYLRQYISTYASTFLVGHRNVIAIMNTTSSDANYYLWPPDTFNYTAGEAVDYWPTNVDAMPADLKNSTDINGTTLVSIFNPTLSDRFQSATVPSNVQAVSYPTYQWLCNYYTITGACTAQSALAFGDSWEITPAMYPIEVCYSEIVPPLCKLQYASMLVGIVLICNAIKTIHGLDSMETLEA